MRKRFFGLKRGKIRQSWNIYNLYNLARAESPKFSQRTYFQQKWTSKAITRAYHGETVREKHWQRMFRSRIRSVVPLDHHYLARHDGSEQALGRGSGLDVPPEEEQKKIGRTPYMNMVYAPVERRLDTAVFRALFASSTRQARQFVVHGYVKVNGKKMVYPGYQLNPGDMFQVEPERVLFATGAPKDKNERRAGRLIRRKPTPSSEESTEELPEPSQSETQSEPKDPKAELTTLLNRAKSILSAGSSSSLAAKRKQDLRAFQRLLKRTLSRSPTSTTLTDSLDAQLRELTSRLNISSDPPSIPTTPDASTPHSETPPATLSADDRRVLRTALEEARDNPIDPSKTYATPWRPRDYMSPFAFVPRYLEVNQYVCSAVYLRHPVARPGLGEVPTPYGTEVNGLAFNWYLRRR
ncbi:mitochondrial 37S ribosomal protein nam9 [Lignoscripta atroalba]|nr:mitochondrial 37S ribosomal protein nam9 [Lignoscripta atroalba]